MSIHRLNEATSCFRITFHRSANRSRRRVAHVVIEDASNKKLRSHSIDRCVSQARWVLEFPLVSVERLIPIWTVVDSLSFFFLQYICQWSAWSRFLRGMLRKGWFSSCVIAYEREIWMNSTSFRILRDGLSKETHSCRWCMTIDFLDLVRSLVVDLLPFFISLARLSVGLNSFIHLHSCILAGMLSGGILLSSFDSFDDHLGPFRSTFRIGGWRREFLYFTHLPKVLRSPNR